MNFKYSIIIPVYNEISSIAPLISELEPYAKEGHQVIIIDDGSTDGSSEILSKNKFINLISFDRNHGKGIASRAGLAKTINKKLIIFDGDRELNPQSIQNLMILDKAKGIECVFASRYKNKIDIDSIWNLGNLIITKLFNYVNGANLVDALCCAKSFYKSDLNFKDLDSKKFDIDVELACRLIKKKNKTVYIEYERRKKKDGKKLGIEDSLRIIYRIFKSKI